MAPKKNVISAFLVYMFETQKLLAEQGIKKDINDMSEYCQKDWDKMPDCDKHDYKIKANKIKSDRLQWSIGHGKNVDVTKDTERSKLLANAMYSYIEELVRMEPTIRFTPKQKIIFVHINSYSCEKNHYYFPAEITLTEFSLENGFIRSFHELLSFDKTVATLAQTADINIHAKHNHRITTFETLPSDYKATFFKLISKYNY